MLPSPWSARRWVDGLFTRRGESVAGQRISLSRRADLNPSRRLRFSLGVAGLSMNRKTLILAGALLLVPVAAQATIADIFKQFDHGAVADKNFVKTLIVGIADGFDAANDQLKETGKPMLYCAPDTIKFTGDQLIDILRRWVAAHRAQTPRIDTAPPSTALLYALEDAFPCPN